MSFLKSMTALRKATLIGTAVLLGLLVASWMFVLSPRSDAIAATNAEVDVASASNDTLRDQISTRRAQEAQLPELRKVDKALSGRFPPTAEQAKMFQMITAAAGQAGLAPSAVTNLTVNPPVNGTGGQASSAQLPGIAAPVAEIASQQVTMDVKGTAEQIRKMMRNLEELPRAFQVLTLNVTNGGPADPADQNEVEMQSAAITGAMYLLPTLADPLATTKATTSKTAASKTAAKK